MIDKIALAACFRHNPDKDGDTIPASLTRPDPRRDWDVVVDPIVGFMAVAFKGRLWWSFIRYEAPWCGYPHRNSKHPVYRLARMATTRVGHIACVSCGTFCLYPVWGKPEEMRCPECGHRGLEVAYVKETSDEFMQLLGDLKEPLEQAVKAVEPSTANEFRFPELLVLGRFCPSTGIPCALQAKATSRGLALRLARQTIRDDLFSSATEGDDTGLLIMPGIVTGVLDVYQARTGWVHSEGVLIETVRLPWLPVSHVHQSDVRQFSVPQSPVMSQGVIGVRL